MDSIKTQEGLIDKEKAMYVFKAFAQAIGHDHVFWVGDLVCLTLDVLSESDSGPDVYVVTACIIQVDLSLKYGIKHKDEYLEVYGFEIMPVELARKKLR